MNLNGKVAIITGGASGIGRGTVDVFLNHGAKVACFDMQDDKGAAMATQFGDDFVYHHVDVTKDAELAAAVNATVAQFGRLDIIFNNAGAAEDRLSHPLNLDVFDGAYRLLLRSVVAGIKYAVPHMVKTGGGSIINTASIAGMQAGYGPIGYSVAKAGVIHLTRVLAARLSRYKIRINAICPGAIATSIFGRAMGDSIEVADQKAAMIAQLGSMFQPIAKAGMPEDIGNTALFFASDYSSFITGQSLAVDGGITIGPRAAWDPQASGGIGALSGMTPEEVERMIFDILRED